MTIIDDSFTDGDAEGGDEDVLHADITPEYDGYRFDKAVAGLFPEFSRTRLQGLIESGDCLLNGSPPKSSSMKISAGGRISLSMPPVRDCHPQPQAIPLDIVYEDDSVIVVNKAAGMVVHPAVGNEDGTLVNALLYHCGETLSGIGGVRRPGIVHRLDKDTSGLMVVAKTDTAHQGLSAQLLDRSLSRIYSAFVTGRPQLPTGSLDFPVGRHKNNRLKMAVISNGRAALTHYKTIENFGEEFAHIECRLSTGRTHQIRVHFEHIGHPLIGDPLYGRQKTGIQSLLKKGGFDDESRDDIVDFPRQALHARELGFIHPLMKEHLSFSVPLPPDLLRLENVLRQQ